jgi:hypothetical protein
MPSIPHKYQVPSQESSHGQLHPILKKSYLQAVQEGHDMEARYPGDPRGRPARAFCAVSATGSIRRRRDELIDKAIVCSFDGNSHEYRPSNWLKKKNWLKNVGEKPSNLM